LGTEYYLVGRVRRAHGIRGELVVEALTDAPDAIFAAGRRVFAGTTEGDLASDGDAGGARELRVVHSTPFKGGLIVAFEGIVDRNTAESWRDRTLLVPEDEIEPPADDEIFIHDLVGMRVVRPSGDEIGEIAAVFELPQGLVLEVRRRAKKPVLLPYNQQTVTSVDSEKRVITVDPIEGLLD
jgi:16S rRNA processing protein RimM